MEENGLTLLQLERDRQACFVLHLQLAPIDRELVAPGLDGEQVAADAFEGQVGRPAVVAQRRHQLLAPWRLV